MNRVPLFWDKEYLNSFDQNSVLLSYDTVAQILVEVDDLILTRTSISNTLLLSGQINERSFNSTLLGTFGGIYSTIDFNPQIFLIKTIEYLSDKYKINSFKFRLPSNHLFEFNQHRQIQNLLDLGFVIDLIEYNYVINLAIWSLNSMSKGNRKKLNQGHSNNLIFKKLNIGHLDSVYQLLSENRKHLGVDLSTDLDQLTKLMQLFPDRYFLFGVYLNDYLIAASVVVETYTTNLYVFYWGDDINHRHLSPTTFLAKGLIDFAKNNNYNYLDLGTVGPKGEYIQSLAKYKMNLGASLHFKFGLQLTNIEL